MNSGQETRERRKNKTKNQTNKLKPNNIIMFYSHLEGHEFGVWLLGPGVHFHSCLGADTQELHPLMLNCGRKE